MHLGVQRLYSPVHHLGEPRNILNPDYRDLLASQSLSGPTSRNDLPSEGHELAGELDDAAFVRD